MHESKRKLLSEKETISVLELYKELSEFYAILGDGHTNIGINNSDIRIIDDSRYYGVYGTPTAINGIDINDSYQIFLKRKSYEVESYLKHSFWGSDLCLEPILALADIDTSKEVIFTYNTKNGLKDVLHNFILYKDYVEPTESDIKLFLENEGFDQQEIDAFFTKTESKETTNENVKIGGDKSSFCWYQIDSENNVGIFTLEECTNNDHYLNTLRDFFTDVVSENISNIAVDLRWNGGGDSQVAVEFIKYLNVESYDFISEEYRNGATLKYISGKNKKNASNGTNYSGNVYVLTNTFSFSAAMIFPQIIQDNHIGKIIGEPSGNKPNCYTSINFSSCPHSKIQLSVSTEIHHRIDQTKGDALLEPDFPCESSQAINLLYDIVQDN